MTYPVFWRLVWKEYRLLRSFWVSLAAISVVLQLVDVWSKDVHIDVFIVALAAPVLFALVSGGTLFAAEHEAKTFGFQRWLPVSSRMLLAGKLSPARPKSGNSVGFFLFPLLSRYSIRRLVLQQDLTTPQAAPR